MIREIDIMLTLNGIEVLTKLSKKDLAAAKKSLERRIAKGHTLLGNQQRLIYLEDLIYTAAGR